MAETSGLLNRRTGFTGTEGSNPSVSASALASLEPKKIGRRPSSPIRCGDMGALLPPARRAPTSLAIANRAFRKSGAAAFRASSTGSACWAKRRPVRQDLLWRGILPIIPPEANRREPPARDFRRYRDRNQVERVLRYK